MADFYELDELLHYKSLTEVYQEAGRQGAGPNSLFDFYTAGPVKQFQTDQVEFLTLSRVRDPSPINFRDQPARVITPTGKGMRRLTMLRMFNSMRLGMGAMQMLRQPEVYALQVKGKQEITQQMEDVATRNQYTKYLFLAKALTKGIVYLDANGDILESSSGSLYSVDLGVPAANQGQIAKSGFGMGSGDIIATKWSDSSAKILTQLDNLNEAAERQNSEPVRHVWLFRSNKHWIRENTEILAFYAAGKERLDRDLNGETFEIGGYTFHFYGGMYTAQDNSTQPFIPAAGAVITPDVGSWAINASGLEYVPSDSGVAGQTVEQALGDLDEVYGDFSYVAVNHNPPSIDLFMGSNWMYAFKNPKSVFQPTVDF